MSQYSTARLFRHFDLVPGPGGGIGTLIRQNEANFQSEEP